MASARRAALVGVAFAEFIESTNASSLTVDSLNGEKLIMTPQCQSNRMDRR
jgi:hypothetical protein